MTDREFEMKVDRQMQSDYTEYRNEQKAKSYEEQLRDENAELKKIVAELKEKLEDEKDYNNFITNNLENKIVELKDEIKAKEELIRELLFKIKARDGEIYELKKENFKLNEDMQWYLCEIEDTKVGLLEDENAELREKIKELEDK